jgi:serine/threonine protein kinase
LLDDNGRVKVCDFGLSLAQPEHSKGFRSSRIVGTPLYTSPETIKGKTITTKADVYSYGVVLYAHHSALPVLPLFFIFYHFDICFILTLFVTCRWQILTRLEPFLECVRVHIFFFFY